MKIKLNSDQEVVDTIREGLKRTSGYCPCRVERTEKNAGTLKVGKINVDEQMELAMRFQVSSIPMLVVFKDGKAVAKSVGYRSKPVSYTHLFGSAFRQPARTALFGAGRL